MIDSPVSCRFLFVFVSNLLLSWLLFRLLNLALSRKKKDPTDFQSRVPGGRRYARFHLPDVLKGSTAFSTDQRISARDISPADLPASWWLKREAASQAAMREFYEID